MPEIEITEEMLKVFHAENDRWELRRVEDFARNQLWQVSRKGDDGRPSIYGTYDDYRRAMHVMDDESLRAGLKAALANVEVPRGSIGSPKESLRAKRSGKRFTEAEIDAARSPKGAWTARTLAGWGVPWPPPKGWRRALIEGRPVPKR